MSDYLITLHQSYANFRRFLIESLIRMVLISLAVGFAADWFTKQAHTEVAEEQFQTEQKKIRENYEALLKLQPEALRERQLKSWRTSMSLVQNPDSPAAQNKLQAGVKTIMDRSPQQLYEYEYNLAVAKLEESQKRREADKAAGGVSLMSGITTGFFVMWVADVAMTDPERAKNLLYLLAGPCVLIGWSLLNRLSPGFLLIFSGTAGMTLLAVWNFIKLLVSGFVGSVALPFVTVWVFREWRAYRKLIAEAG